MAETPAISVQNLAKAYRIWSSPAARLTSPLQHSLGGALPGALGGSALQRRAAAAYRDFWALQDISLTVKRGEAVGIIGRNGSGKSTLLQIIAGTLQPTSGTAQVSGRVAALLELGAGFNGDYTGRENVLLNGAVLGLKPEEIEAKFDDIAAYADIGDFIDQPVRTYSTGMQMRLAFAVAAHVDAEVLIIDEALSVGDARFQLKCAKTIDRLVESGKTLLFVSHDFFAVKRLCDRAILLDKGRLVMDDEPNPVVNHYTKLIAEGDAPDTPRAKTPPPAAPAAKVAPPRTGGAPDSRLVESQQALARLMAGAPWQQKFERLAADHAAAAADPAGFNYGGQLGRIDDVQLLDREGKDSLAFLTGEPAVVRFVARATEDVPGPIYALTVKNTLGQDIYVTNTLYTGMTVPDVSAGQAVQVEFALELNLMPGEYFLSFGWVTHVGDTLLVIHRRYDAVKFAVLPVDRRVGIANLRSVITVSPA